MSDAIDAAARAIYEKASNGVVKWTNVRSEERQDYFDYAGAAIAAYRDSEIEALRAKLADCQAVIAEMKDRIGCGCGGDYGLCDKCGDALREIEEIIGGRT